MTPIDHNANSPVFNALIASAAFVVVVAGVNAARIIVIPFLLSVFIAVILSAILTWLRERGIKTSVAFTLMILILGVLGTLMVAVVGASVNELVRKLPQINSAVKMQEQQLAEWLEEHGFTMERIEKPESPEQTLEYIVPGLVPAPDRGPSDEKNSQDAEKSQPEAESAPDKQEQPATESSSPSPAEPESAETSQTSPPATRGDPQTRSTATDAVESRPAAETNRTSPARGPETRTGSEDSPRDQPLGTEAAREMGTALTETPVVPASAEEEPAESLPLTTRETEWAPQQPTSVPLPAGTFEEQGPVLELFPNYIFGQQKHVIRLRPSDPAGEGSSQFSPFLGNYSPVEIFRSFLDSVMGMFNYALIVFLMLLFLMLEWARFGQKLERLPGNTQSYVEQVSEILSSIRRYMLIKTLVSLLTGLLITSWLLMLGTSYALLWGTVAFLFNYIPTIGSIIAGIVPTLFVLVDQGPIEALWVALAFLVVNFLIGNLLEPRIMGEGLGLSTFVVFLSLVFWGFVLGPIGMLLAVPLTMAIKIALGSDERTKWISVLLGSGKYFDTPEPHH